MRAFSLLRHGAAIVGLAGIGLAFGAGPRETDQDWLNKVELTDGGTSSVHIGTASAAGVEGKAGAKKDGGEAKEGKKGTDPAPTSSNTEFRYMGAPGNPWQLNVSP